MQTVPVGVHGADGGEVLDFEVPDRLGGAQRWAADSTAAQSVSRLSGVEKSGADVLSAARASTRSVPESFSSIKNSNAPG